MAWSAIGHYGSAQNKTSGTTLQLFQPAAAIAAGSVIVVAIAVDNQQTTDGVSTLVSSVVGSASGTFTKALEYTNGEGAPNAGVTCAVYYRYVTGTITAGADTITVTLSTAKIAKCAHSYIFSNTGSTCHVAAVSGSVSDVDPDLMTLDGLPSREYLFLRVVATERGNFGFGASANYTVILQNTTTAPGDETDVAIGGEYRIFTSTTDSTNPTTGTPQSASVYVAFMDSPGNVTTAVTGVSSGGSVGAVGVVAGNNAIVVPAGVFSVLTVGTTTQGASVSVVVSGVVSATGRGDVVITSAFSTPPQLGLSAAATLGTATAVVERWKAVNDIASTVWLPVTTE